MPATAQDTEALKAALLAKGMLADRGRYTPFASLAGGADDSVSQSTGMPGSNAVVVNAASGDGSSASSGAAIVPNTPNALPVSDDTLNKMSEGDATDLLVALGITGAAALTAYLARRRTKLASPEAESVPLVEGETVSPKATDNIVDGEFTEVPTKQISGTKMITQNTEVPDNQGIKALGAPKEVNVPKLTKAPPKVNRRTLAQSVAERARRGQPNDTGSIPLDDSFSDLTPVERRQVQSLTDQLQANRYKGNAANVRRLTGDRTVRSTRPTGTVNEDSILNQVVRMVRMARLKPGAIAKAIP